MASQAGSYSIVSALVEKEAKVNDKTKVLHDNYKRIKVGS